MEIGSIITPDAASALIGAVIGGAATLLATLISSSLSKKNAKVEHLLTIVNSIKLIKVELQAAWDIYRREYADELESLEDGEPCICLWPIGKDTFTIYNSMPNCLVEIGPLTSAKVVEVYMRLKGLVAMIEENNSFVLAAKKAGHEKLSEMVGLAEKQGDSSLAENAAEHQAFYEDYVRLEAIKTEMGLYADAMKRLSCDIAAGFEDILLSLDNEINELNLTIAKLG